VEIVQFPHPTLRRVSKPLKRVDKQLKSMVEEMFSLMYQAKGIGLAANQVDLPFRLFIVNLSGEKGQGEERVFLNPVLSAPKGRAVAEEGCLSFPQLYHPVARPDQIRVQAYDLAGNAIDQTVEGLLSRVIQHEFDHLEGVLFIDRIEPGDQKVIEPALEEFEFEFSGRRASGSLADDPTIEKQLRELESKYC
jgi:peptide deformylase